MFFLYSLVYIRFNGNVRMQHHFTFARSVIISTCATVSTCHSAVMKQYPSSITKATMDDVSLIVPMVSSMLNISPLTCSAPDCYFLSTKIIPPSPSRLFTITHFDRLSISFPHIQAKMPS